MPSGSRPGWERLGVGLGLDWTGARDSGSDYRPDSSLEAAKPEGLPSSGYLLDGVLRLAFG